MHDHAPSIVWFRQDFRLADNPALTRAAATGAIIPVYIHDEKAAGKWRDGGAGKVWLHHSLDALNRALGGHLLFRSGDSGEILERIAAQADARSVFWNKSYEPWRSEQDQTIADRLAANDIATESFHAATLYDPARTLKSDGSPYRVYTPFYRKGCLARNGEPDAPLPVPKMTFARHDLDTGSLADLTLLPTTPRWDRAMIAGWVPGEAGALAQLEDFTDRIADYAEGRNFADRPSISRLSPHLHWGEISPRQIWQALRQHTLANAREEQADRFFGELGWREFNINLLLHTPTMPEQAWNKKFAQFRWRDSRDDFARWAKGQTGYPIVDAGMRELWQTGFMHNRVRMITASFLVKDLLLPWQWGQDWFWDCLVDADLANNSANWQWVAGSGADASPFFRIFNPVTQGQKFDPSGDYVRRWVPELAGLPTGDLHAPWLASDTTLRQAGIVLGETYPRPMVDHRMARDRALAALAEAKAA